MMDAWPIVTLSPIVVGCVPVIAWTTVPSWMFDRLPIRIRCTSPRITVHIQTPLSSPISTSPITCALSSTKAVGWTRGIVPRYGRSTDELYRADWAQCAEEADAGQERMSPEMSAGGATDVGRRLPAGRK